MKVISGDNPVTVSEVARQAGIEGAEKYVDAATLRSDEDIARAVREYTVFGQAGFINGETLTIDGGWSAY